MEGIWPADAGPHTANRRQGASQNDGADEEFGKGIRESPYGLRNDDEIEA